MLNVILVTLASLIVVIIGSLLLGHYRWKAGTQALRARLNAALKPVQPQTVHFGELEELPAPVQRFFRTALTEGQPMVVEVRVQHQGTFNTSEATEQWKPFTSDQKIVAQRPGFDWNGRIVIMPGLVVRVHDAYVAGEGILHASLLGLFSLVNQQGADDLAQGELMRFLAEAAWYPTALLPSQGVHWEPVDGYSAYATLSDGVISVTLLFAFNESGLIETVSAEARGRMVKGKSIPTRWQGHFWNYRECDGMQVPLDGEVAWLLSDKAKPYWRGHITKISYEFTQQ